MANPDEAAASGQDRRPVVLRGGTVLTMDDAHTVLADADVLVTGDTIAAVGPRLAVPDGTLEIDASGGIVMPGNDRHPPAHVADGHARLRRGLDADPVLRLELPGTRAQVPPGGHPRRQPRLRLGSPRGRRDQRIAATGGTISVSTESEQSAGQGYPPRADLAAVRRAVEATVGYLRAELGEQAWAAGMNPDLPTTEVLDNPYQYTEFKSESTHGARGSIFGEG